MVGRVESQGVDARCGPAAVSQRTRACLILRLRYYLSQGAGTLNGGGVEGQLQS